MRRLPVVIALAAAGCNADLPPPLIASITPDHAPPGAVITVTGSYFCQNPMQNPDDPTCPPTGTVNFGTMAGTTTTWTDTAIMVEVPSAPPSRPSVTVTASGRLSNAVAFTID